jgi:PAS domain S-box-containing protein
MSKPESVSQSDVRPSWIVPFGLAGRGWEYPFAIACVGILILINVAERATASDVVIGTLAFVPVLAAAWLLSTPIAVVVACVAIGLFGLATATGALRPITGAAEGAVLLLLAIGLRLYARRLLMVLRGTTGDPTPGAPIVFGLESLGRLVDSSVDGVVAIDQRRRILYVNATVADVLQYSQQQLLSTDFLTYIDPKDRPEIATYFAETAIHGSGRLTVRAVRASGDTCELDLSHTLVQATGRSVIAIVFRDITEARRMQRAGAVLAQTAANLAVTQPIERMLDAVAESVVDVTDAVAAGVFLLEGERNLRTAATVGLPPDYIEAMDLATSGGAARPALEAITTRADVVHDDLPGRILDDPRFAPVHALIRNVSWKVVVTIPMIYGGRPLGALSAYFLHGQRPNERTITFLRGIAGLAASAAETFRLVSAQQGQVALEERQRLSRELHDSLSQALYGIALGARSAQNRLTSSPERAAEPLDYILRLAEAALADMRSLILDLRPESLEREGLVAALRERSAAVTGRYGIDVAVDVPDEPPLSPSAKQAIYRIALEALANVVKHSHAKHATLRLDTTDDYVTLELADDGAGFDPSGSYPGHFGLQSMRERAESHGGELQLDSEPGRGTTIRARVPFAGSASLASAASVRATP